MNGKRKADQGTGIARGAFRCFSPLGRIVGCTSRCYIAGSPGFDAEFVVDRYSQMLPAANIALGGLHRDMPEEKLDLFKLASGIMAEPRTGPSQIMRR